MRGCILTGFHSGWDYYPTQLCRTSLNMLCVTSG